MTKIVKFSERLEFSKKILDLNKQEIALAYGHFSSIHPGHIRYLQNAKSFGSKLVIGLRGDNDKPKSEKYIFSMKERSESLAMLKIADLLVSLVGRTLTSRTGAWLPSADEWATRYARFPVILGT